MPRLIFKCPYIQGGSKKAAAHLSNYVRYMATREGAQRLPEQTAQLPATEKQRQMVERLLRDFPLSRGTFEYEDYAAAPTRGNASDFITRALEDNYDRAAKKENYVQYIAGRPRAQRRGSHALFNGSDETLTLSRVAEEIAHHPGNVWLPIISLRREDAARLGYDDAERWKCLLTGCAMEMAQALKIPWDQFRWYAAFHDESHHPHVHMVCYSADGKSGYLTKDGIAQIKSELAGEIFRQDLTELYRQQTQRRDALNQDAQAVMREEVLRTYKNDLPERLPLSRQKEFKSIKNMVIREAVRLGELRQVFHPEDHGEDALPEQEEDGPQPEPGPVWEEVPPDSGEPRASWEQAYRRAQAILKDPHAAPEQTARAVKLLTQAAEHGNGSAAFTLGQLYLSGTTLPRDPAAAVRWLERAAESGNQYAQYRLGKLLLQGEDVPKDTEAAVRWLAASAEQGSQYAQYALGKLYLMGGEVPEDREAARQWFQRAAEQGNQYAQYFVEHMGRRDLFPVAQSVAQLLHHLAGIFREQSQPPRPGGLRPIVDKKLRRKIREKKIAMGHKPDDHEEPTITM